MSPCLTPLLSLILFVKPYGVLICVWMSRKSSIMFCTNSDGKFMCFIVCSRKKKIPAQLQHTTALIRKTVFWNLPGIHYVFSFTNVLLSLLTQSANKLCCMTGGWAPMEFSPSYRLYYAVFPMLICGPLYYSYSDSKNERFSNVYVCTSIWRFQRSQSHHLIPLHKGVPCTFPPYLCPFYEISGTGMTACHTTRCNGRTQYKVFFALLRTHRHYSTY